MCMAVFGNLPKSVLDEGIEVKSAGIGGAKARLWWVHRSDEERFIELVKAAGLQIGWLHGRARD